MRPPPGTSPHAWGKHPFEVYQRDPEWNIPTCVGKTRGMHAVGSLGEEHPHMRGENAFGRLSTPVVPGTSPHAWGKLRRKLKLDGKHRNIPTCVGKTARRRDVHNGRTEHPHMRGENLPESETPLICGGTSPHAWGKPRQRGFRAARPRNIPTCVGKT